MLLRVGRKNQLKTRIWARLLPKPIYLQRETRSVACVIWFAIFFTHLKFGALTYTRCLENPYLNSNWIQNQWRKYFFL